MQIELKQLQREVGITFIYVTHDQEEALTMSDVIVVMRDGRIQQQGHPEDLYERPVNRFVAGFVGDVELPRRHARRRSTASDGHRDRRDRLAACASAARLTDDGATPAAGDQVTIAIRPEAPASRRPSRGAEPEPATG